MNFFNLGKIYRKYLISLFTILEYCNEIPITHQNTKTSLLPLILGQTNLYSELLTPRLINKDQIILTRFDPYNVPITKLKICQDIVFLLVCVRQ